MNFICNRLASLGIETTKVISPAFFHTGSSCFAWSKSEVPKNFIAYNRKIYPPQGLDEEPRKAVSKNNCKLSSLTKCMSIGILLIVSNTFFRILFL